MEALEAVLAIIGAITIIFLSAYGLAAIMEKR